MKCSCLISVNKPVRFCNSKKNMNKQCFHVKHIADIASIPFHLETMHFIIKIYVGTRHCNDTRNGITCISHFLDLILTYHIT